MRRKAPWGSKGRGHHPVGAVNLPIALCTESISAKICTCQLERDLGQVRCGKEVRQLAKGKQRLEELSCVRDLNHLFTAFLSIREDAHPFSPVVVVVGASLPPFWS